MPGNGTVNRMVQIHFPVGIHVRPATMIAQEARKHPVEVFLVYNDRRASTRNVFDMFLLGAEKGAQVTLEAADGPDSQEALDCLAALFTPEAAKQYAEPEEA
jgi:phosphotransferase system HPr (HPr) family protein